MLRIIREYRAALVLAALYFGTAGVLMLAFNRGGWEPCATAFAGGWAACDQLYHIVQINYFIQNPAALFHYPDPVATLPGFHLFVAGLARLGGLARLDPDTWLRTVPFLFGLGVLGILWRTFRDLSNNGGHAALLCLPILWSNYFYLSSLFLVTENAAYLGYAFLLLAYLEFPQRGVAIGAAGAATVFARQIFLPVVATPLIMLAGQRRPRRIDGRTIRAVLLATLPPFLVFLTYYFAWGGPVPPELVDEHSTHAAIEPGPVLQAVSLLGLLAVPYGFATYPSLCALGRRRIVTIVAAACVVGGLMWIVLPSTRDLDEGRAGSVVWLLARLAPLDHERALLVLPCLVLGCAAGAAMIALARSRRYFPVELVMFGLYLAALSMQRLSYQRYSEVVTLITLSTTAARLGPLWRPGIAVFLASYFAKLLVTVFMPHGG